MYSKTGLSALAIAGLTFGVVGMMMNASGASSPDCISPSSGVSAPATGVGIGGGASGPAGPLGPSSSAGASGNAGTGDNTSSGNPATNDGNGSGIGIGTGTTTPSAGTNGNGSNGNGSNGNGTNGNGNGDGSGSAAGSDNRGSSLVDIDAGANNGTGVHVNVPGDGSAPTVGTSSGATGSSDDTFLDLQANGSSSTPPLHVVGRSATIRQLLHVTGAVNLAP